MNSRNVFLMVLEAGSLRSGYQHGWVRVLFWSRRLLSVSSRGRTGCGTLWNLCALMLFTPVTWSFPQGNLLNHHLWGLRLQLVIPEGTLSPQQYVETQAWLTDGAPMCQLSVAFSCVAWSWPNPYSSSGNFPIMYSSPSSLSNFFILYVFLLPGGESKDTFWKLLDGFAPSSELHDGQGEPSMWVIRQ